MKLILPFCCLVFFFASCKKETPVCTDPYYHPENTGEWNLVSSNSPNLYGQSYIDAATDSCLIFAQSVYIFNSYKTILQLYKHRTGTWFQTINMMANNRENASILALGDDIYVIGGYAASTMTTSVFRYRISTGAWTMMNTFPENHAQGYAAVVNGNGYLLGGGSRKVRQYDPNSDTWIDVDSLPITLYNYKGNTMVVGDEIFMYGNDSLHIYNVVTQSFESIIRENSNEETDYDLAYTDGSHIYVPSYKYSYGYASNCPNQYEIVRVFDPVTREWGIHKKYRKSGLFQDYVHPYYSAGEIYFHKDNNLYRFEK